MSPSDRGMASSGRPDEQADRLQALCNRIGLNQGVAYDATWSAAPDFLELIVDHALAHKPDVIVECGSGVSTLMLARCCELYGRGCAADESPDQRRRVSVVCPL